MTATDFEPTIINKLYELYKRIFTILQKFPKRERYSLGERLENVTLETVELVSLCNIQMKNFREPILYKASAKIETAKLLIRLSYDLNLVTDHQYLDLENKTKEIGKMIGGWIKYVRAT